MSSSLDALALFNLSHGTINHHTCYRPGTSSDKKRRTQIHSAVPYIKPMGA